MISSTFNSQRILGQTPSIKRAISEMSPLKVTDLIEIVQLLLLTSQGGQIGRKVPFNSYTFLFKLQSFTRLKDPFEYFRAQIFNFFSKKIPSEYLRRGRFFEP